LGNVILALKTSPLTICLIWTTFLDHWHPFLDTTFGNNVTLSSAPSPEDHLAATNSYLEIIMYATDDNGLTSSAVRTVYPRLVEMCLDSFPRGLEIYVDEYPITTPLMITSWENHDLRLRAFSAEGYNFSSWSDAILLEDRRIRMEKNSTPGILALFCVDGTDRCTSSKVQEARCPTDSPTVTPSGPVPKIRRRKNT